MAEKVVIGGIVALVIVYLLIDFFWGGGLVRSPIFERMNETLNAF